MGGLSTKGQVKEVRLRGRIIRADGTVEDLGTLAYWNSNLFRRLLTRLRGTNTNKRRS